MARNPYPYRASEPTQLETQLAIGALDPEKSGMALAMLPGAASIRQDIGSASGRAYERDQLLAEMTQQQTAKHQDDSTALGIYQLQNPGAVEAAMQTGRFRDLFAGSSPNVSALTQMLTQGQFRMQDANIQDKYADALQKGVVSGYMTPTGTAEQQMGHPIERVESQPIQLERMREAAHARSAASAAAAAKNVPIMMSANEEAPTQPGGSPTIKYGVASFPAELAPKIGAFLRNANANYQPTTFTGQGTTTVEGSQAGEQGAVGYQKTKDGRIIGATGLQTNPSAPQQPMAKTDPGRSGTASTPSTSAAPGTPQGGALFPSVRTTPWSQAPAGLAKTAADELYQRIPRLGLTPQQTQQVKQAHATGNYSIEIGQDRRPYLVMGGIPIVALKQ